MKRRRIILFLIMFGILSGYNFASTVERIPYITEPVETDQILADIEALQLQIVTASSACAGDAAVLPLYQELAALQESYNEMRGRNPHSLDQGGDNCSDARIVNSMPYCDSGNISDHNNDYDPPTTCATSSAGDVVYKFTPIGTFTKSVSLCGSSFNTILHIWRGCPDDPNSVLVCCNNDFCGLQSCCPNVSFERDSVYYIVVDAVSGGGNYVLHIGNPGQCGTDPCPPCSVICSPGATIEPELCPTNNSNNGCYGWPVLFTPISCGETICGKAEWDVGHDYDAYRVQITARDSLRWCVIAEFDVHVQIHQYFTDG